MLELLDERHGGPDLRPDAREVGSCPRQPSGADEPASTANWGIATHACLDDIKIF
jgi:hypothetical protein